MGSIRASNTRHDADYPASVSTQECCRAVLARSREERISLPAYQP